MHPRRDLTRFEPLRLRMPVPEFRPFLHVATRLLVGVVPLLTPGLANAQSPLLAVSSNPHGNLPASLDCTLCHSVEAWTPLRDDSSFDHDRHTSFMILGSHAELTCNRCHRDLRFSASNTESAGCASCHLDVHQSKLGTRCAACHSATTFSDVPALAIHSRTFFPLTGAHLELTCDVCHTDERRGAFSGKDTACVGCHQADYQGARDPDHVAGTFSTRCEGCHGTLGWLGAGGVG